MDVAGNVNRCRPQQDMCACCFVAHSNLAARSCFLSMTACVCVGPIKRENLYLEGS